MSGEKCQLCGEPMPKGEEMFNYHGYSGPCPKPPLPSVAASEPGGPADNDTLADLAAVEVLHTLEAPIAGQPSASIHNYDNARRIVKAALLAVFEKASAAL